MLFKLFQVQTQSEY